MDHIKMPLNKNKNPLKIQKSSPPQRSTVYIFEGEKVVGNFVFFEGIFVIFLGGFDFI
jgi:hypothetical protein